MDFKNSVSFFCSIVRKQLLIGETIAQTGAIQIPRSQDTLECVYRCAKHLGCHYNTCSPLVPLVPQENNSDKARNRDLVNHKEAYLSCDNFGNVGLEGNVTLKHQLLDFWSVTRTPLKKVVGLCPWQRCSVLCKYYYYVFNPEVSFI